MNRNTFNFNDNPISLDTSRSRFNRDSSVKMSFNVGLPNGTLRFISILFFKLAMISPLNDGQ